jgi:hypothetical protein
VFGDNSRYLADDVGADRAHPGVHAVPQQVFGPSPDPGRAWRGRLGALAFRGTGRDEAASGGCDALRPAVSAGQGQLFEADCIINIFNISKINSEVRGAKLPRIKRLQEVLGESYFEYLARQRDLVLLMDEAHRYRASSGARAINELRPIIGLELTATPRETTGRDFRNVIFSYSLGDAMADGFVKEPAVATRANFKADDYRDRSQDLERISCHGVVHGSDISRFLPRVGRHGREQEHRATACITTSTSS